MKEAQNPDHVALSVLLDQLKKGEYTIPDFQREFEWDPWDIRDLVRSIFLDYFIGSLLLWKGKKENFESLSCEPIYGFSGKSSPRSIVLDGQQRLTAVYYAFVAPNKSLPNRSSRAFYYIQVDEFMAENYDEAFGYQWASKSVDLLQLDKQYQFEHHYFPLSVIGDEEDPYWVRDYVDYWKEKAQSLGPQGEPSSVALAQRNAAMAKEFGNYLKELIKKYQVSYIELDEELEIDKVCDIFTQLNSKGVRLDVFDLMNALLKPKAVQLKDLWRNASERLRFVETEKMNVYVLQTMSILRQGYCSPKYLYYLMPNTKKQIRDPDGNRRSEVLVQTSEEFENRWHRAVKALEDAMNLLRNPHEFGVISGRFLPYASILPIFAALQAEQRSLPIAKSLSADRKIRQWYWASIFLNRYSGSVESTSARDYLDVKAWMEDDELRPRLIDDFEQQFRQLDFRKESTSTAAIYKAVFNLLVINGARDWVTNKAPQFADLDDHHIVPGAWEGGVPRSQLNSILNKTPLTAATNRHIIRDRLPNVYLREMIVANGRQFIEDLMQSHFISPVAIDILLRDPFTKSDYEAFIDERQRSIQRAIEDKLIKERIDLPPDLAELDDRIEETELGLRAALVSVFADDPSVIPDHIGVRIDDRIGAAKKRDTTLDEDQLKSLHGRLIYADLQELKDIIVSKSVWASLESRFRSKSTVEMRFNQLAEARNSIRHSRGLSGVAEADAKAALLWFVGALGKSDNSEGTKLAAPAIEINRSDEMKAVVKDEDGTISSTNELATRPQKWPLPRPLSMEEGQGLQLDQSTSINDDQTQPVRFAAPSDRMPVARPLKTRKQVEQFLVEVIGATPEVISDDHEASFIRFTVPELDLPELRHAEDWTSSKRMLLFEFRNYVDSLQLALVVGPGDQSVRQILIDGAASSDTSLLRKATGKLHAGIHSQILANFGFSNAPRDLALSESILAGWEHFLKSDLQTIVTGLKGSLVEVRASFSSPDSESVSATDE